MFRKALEKLVSQNEKHKNLNSAIQLRKPKNKIEELELEIMKKILRLLYKKV